MRSLSIPPADPCLEAHTRSKGGSANWKNLEPECRLNQRAVLVDNQNKLCAWCEQAIKADYTSSHVDHIKTQAGHPGKTLSTQNIVASCNGMAAPHGNKKTGHYCGHARKGRVDIPDSLNPYLVPELREKYTIRNNGEIQLIDEAFSEDDLSEVERAINVQLNLNDRVLLDKRENRLKQLNNYGDQLNLEQALEIFPDFLTLTHQYF